MPVRSGRIRPGIAGGVPIADLHGGLGGSSANDTMKGASTMSMLGAELGQLESLRGQIDRTTGDIGDASTETNRITTDLVSSARQAASTAFGQINTALAALIQSVNTSQSQAASTNWTGVNYATFTGAVGQFQGAMSQAQAATGETFQNFNTAVDTLASDLEDYVRTFQSKLTEAGQSTVSMSGAVQGQRDNLDQVMNTGISVG